MEQGTFAHGTDGAQQQQHMLVHLPQEILSQVYLKHLSLQDAATLHCVSCVGKQQAESFLDLWKTTVVKLHKSHHHLPAYAVQVEVCGKQKVFTNFFEDAQKPYVHLEKLGLYGGSDMYIKINQHNINCLARNMCALQSLSCKAMYAVEDINFSKLVQLQSLELWNCLRMYRQSEGLSCLTNLTSLKFGLDYKLKTLPCSLSCLKRLEILTMSACFKLTHVPELLKLRSLELSRCHALTTVPQWLSRSTCLQSLTLSSCDGLTSLPDWLSGMVNLQSLAIDSICGDKIPAGELPHWLSCMIHLQFLDLSGNRITNLPDGLSCLVKLQTLRLCHNDMTILPDWINCLIDLQNLHLSGCNAMTGLPPVLKDMVNLQHLDLLYNQWVFSLSDVLSTLVNLHTLNLQNCQKLHSLPEWLSCFVNLQHIHLFGCNTLMHYLMG
jgi:hypothetical protein